MKRIWDTDELAAVWSLKHDELNLLKTKPARNHLGFVVQLKHYLLTGRFLNNRYDISRPSPTVPCKSTRFVSFRYSIIWFYRVFWQTASHRNPYFSWYSTDNGQWQACIYWLANRGSVSSWNKRWRSNRTCIWLVFEKQNREPYINRANRLTRAAFNRYEKGLFITIISIRNPRHFGTFYQNWKKHLFLFLIL